MKSKKERLEKLEEEEFYLCFFEGTLMPNKKHYINITMFDDTFFIENENEEKENYKDMYFIMKVKKMIEENLNNINKMTELNGQPVKTSFKHEICLKINNKTYKIDRNACNNEGQELFDEFKLKLFEMLDIK